MNTSAFNCHWSKRAFVVALLALTVTSCATGEYEGGLSGEGKYHGQGSLVLTSGESYVGYFVNGLKEGIGSLSYTNGDKYVGEWLNN